ncbi:hypothetical protein ASC77_19170 [Nocardioides sp. Root1257]|uniref:hypothetical protein n=1 Tax=unclassified Nocardioides TaxID=2615069 RepID=UPI0007013787|nr:MULTISPECIES: hypothetical protein [unclassified Nocardioides]KQW46025.1 hypothetical protein ASC77_19170 [Nocardioides sp. Root1257]KRC43288.1 hypothetical protein ASE24_20135 [Nocardioides sp. Root224]
MTSATPWEFTDAWVFAAIAVYDRPCSLVELIGAADWINHAVLLETEVESALGKLTAADLVRVYEGWTFELTDDGSSLWSGGVRDLQSQLQVVLDRLELVEPGGARVPLPAGVMDRALEDYRRA